MQPSDVAEAEWVRLARRPFGRAPRGRRDGIWRGTINGDMMNEDRQRAGRNEVESRLTVNCEGGACMNSRNLYWGIAAASIVAVVAACAAQLTQHPSDPAIQVGESDLGGVVAGPQGPEAGVWVIAETTESAHPIRQDRRDRRSRPLPHARICRRRTTACGCAATGWSIRPRCRATPGSDPRSHGGDRAESRLRRRTTTRRSTGTR